MSLKTFIWGGMFVGSAIGGIAPVLWGDTGYMASTLLTAVGGFLGIVAGYWLGKTLGV